MSRLGLLLLFFVGCTPAPSSIEAPGLRLGVVVQFVGYLGGRGPEDAAEYEIRHRAGDSEGVGQMSRLRQVYAVYPTEVRVTGLPKTHEGVEVVRVRSVGKVQEGLEFWTSVTNIRSSDLLTEADREKIEDSMRMAALGEQLEILSRATPRR